MNKVALKDIVEKYKKTIAYKGTGAEGMRSDMKEFMFSEFSNAPNYYVLVFTNEQGDSYEVETRVHTTNKSNVIELSTLPQNKPLSGNMFTFDEKEWIVYDYNDVEVLPKVIALKLNKILQFKHDGEIKFFPCSLVNVRAQTLFQDAVISLPQGQLEVVAQKNEITSLIKPTTRFILNTSSYEVESVDSESKDGVISFIMSTVNKRADDRTEKEKVSVSELW